MFFEGTNVTTEQSLPPNNMLTLPSSFTPALDQLGPEIAVFENTVNTQLTRSLKFIPKPLYNLNREEFIAMKQLTSDKSLTIKCCDKGGGIVVLNTDDYENKMMNMLQDNNFYTQITKNPNTRIQKRIQALTDFALHEGFITPKEYDYLNYSKGKTACIYGVPKIHKNIQDPHIDRLFPPSAPSQNHYPSS